VICSFRDTLNHSQNIPRCDAAFAIVGSEIRFVVIFHTCLRELYDNAHYSRQLAEIPAPDVFLGGELLAASLIAIFIHAGFHRFIKPASQPALLARFLLVFAILILL